MTFVSILLTLCTVGLALWPARDRRISRVLQFALVSRVPLLFLVALVVAPIGIVRSDNELFANLFELERFGDVAKVASFVILACWVAIVCVDVFLEVAPSRMGIDPPSDGEDPGPLDQRTNGRLLSRMTVAALLATPMLASVAYQSIEGDEPPLGLWQILGGVVVGFLAVGAFSLLVWVSTDLLERFVFPWCAERWPDALRPGPDAFPGYFDEETGQVLRKHVYTTGYLCVLAAVYVAGSFLLHPVHGDPSRLPTLAYALGLIALACSLLSGMTFFLDRFRVPALFALAVLGIVSSAVLDPGHYYFADEDVPPVRPRASDALAARLDELDGKQETIVVVAAAGGGITASAWTTRVLAGLEVFFEAQDERFLQRVAFASGVSGGSVGLLHAFAARGSAGPPLDETIAPLALFGDGAAGVQSSGANVLPAVGWGLTYPDLRRLLFPPFSPSRVDRGWAIEEAWAHVLGSPEDLTWARWSASAADGSLPGIAFNTTTLEGGARAVFSTVKLRELFEETRRYEDLGAVSPLVAARLSATFPYVTPTARLEGPRKAAEGEPVRAHLLDGGYFDNSGIVTALEWIHSCFLEDDSGGTAAPTALARVKRIVLLQIDGFPRSEGADEAVGSWQAAVLGPVQGIISVRTGSQRERNERAIKDLAGLLEASSEIELIPVTVRSNRDSPLSWKLTSNELVALNQEWERVLSHLETEVLSDPDALLQASTGIELMETWSRAQPQWRALYEK